MRREVRFRQETPPNRTDEQQDEIADSYPDGGNSAAASRISQHRHSISSMVTKIGHHAAVVGI